MPTVGWTPRAWLPSGIHELTRLILATGVTTMAGLLCLVTHIIIPAEQLGILAAVGVGFAVLGGHLYSGHTFAVAQGQTGH